MTMNSAPEPASAEERADKLKERVYVTFTSLAVVLTMASHAEGLTAGRAATGLVIAVAGTLLAVLVADFVAHLAVHQTMPTPTERRHMIAVSAGALSVIGLPLIFLALAGGGVWPLSTALRASIAALVFSLVVIGYLAVRRVSMPVSQRLIVLGAEALLGMIVIALELLAHG